MNSNSSGQNLELVVSKNPTPSKEKLEKTTTLETTTKVQRQQKPEDQEENVLIAGYQMPICTTTATDSSHRETMSLRRTQN